MANIPFLSDSLSEVLSRDSEYFKDKLNGYFGESPIQHMRREQMKLDQITERQIYGARAQEANLVQLQQQQRKYFEDYFGGSAPSNGFSPGSKAAATSPHKIGIRQKLQGEVNAWLEPVNRSVK